MTRFRRDDIGDWCIVLIAITFGVWAVLHALGKNFGNYIHEYS